MAIYPIICALIFTTALHADWQVHVDAGPHDRAQAVFIGELPDGFPKHRLGDSMIDEVTDKRVFVQADQQGKTIRWIDSVSAGEKRTYKVQFRELQSPQGDHAAELHDAEVHDDESYEDESYDDESYDDEVHDDGQSLVLSSGNAKLQYQYETMPSPEPEKPFHARSGFLHGIRTPSGRLVTDPMPSDHLHQHGVMLAWRNTEFEGRPVNFWEDAAQQGQISHRKIVSKMAGPVFSEIDVQLRHTDRTAPDGDKEVLSESWRIQAYGVGDMAGGKSAREFVWDFESTQKNVSESPLEITKFHYGGFMIRGAAEWIKSPHRMLTSNGDSQVTGNHTRPLWVDINGIVDGQHVGLTTMGHPSNFRFPQSVRLHPKMPYYCFAPMVDGAFEIAPGETFISRFRFIAHDGPLDRKRAVAIWRDWADPPKVTISQVK